MSGTVTYAMFSSGNPRVEIPAPAAGDPRFGAGKNTRFWNMTLKCTIDGVERRVNVITFGEPNALNAQCMGAQIYTGGSDDVSAKKSANLSVGKSQAPDLYAFCEMISNAVQEWATTHAGMIFGGGARGTFKEDKWHPAIATHYSQASRNVERAGLPMPDPICRVKISFDVFSQAFGNLAGRPRSTIYDWKSRTLTRIPGDPPRIESSFEILTDAKGKMANAENISDLIRRGDTIRRIQIRPDSVCYSQQGLSVRLVAHQIYIERTACIAKTIMTPQEQLDDERIQRELEEEMKRQEEESAAAPEAAAAAPVPSFAAATAAPVQADIPRITPAQEDEEDSIGEAEEYYDDDDAPAPAVIPQVSAPRKTTSSRRK